MNVSTKYCYDYLKNETEQIVNNICFSNNPELAKGVWYDDCIGLPYKQTFIDGIEVDAGGLEHNGHLIKNTSLSGWTMGYPYDKKNAIDIKGKVIFLGFICDNCWGHTITDSMTHLWWFLTDDYKNNYIDYDIYYWSTKPLKGVYLELISSIISPEKLYYLDHITHFEHVYVPGDCFLRVASNKLIYTDNYSSLIDKITQYFNNGKCIDKLFITRPNDSRQYTCIDIKKTLKAKGFTEINPVDYSLADQISLLHNAKEVVVEESSASHTLIFCKPGTKATILRKNNCINEYQATTNQMRDLNVQYVDCHLSSFTWNKLESAGPFFLYANEMFCNAFNVQRIPFPYKEFKKHIKRNLYFTGNAKDYVDRLSWNEHYVFLFAKELEWSRKYYEKKFEWIFKLPILKYNLKKRIHTYIIKRIMRNIMSI